METKHVIEALSALAQETRLAIYRLLVEKGPAGMGAGAIAAALDIPASSLSFHLAHLSIYAVDFAGMNALMGYLTENCCGGNPAVCAPACATPPARATNRRKSA
jgi:ArsR family transcriptional regulator, arsenate/arsenite/antimonite-responsive transcriptional repressor